MRQFCMSNASISQKTIRRASTQNHAMNTVSIFRLMFLNEQLFGEYSIQIMLIA